MKNNKNAFLSNSFVTLLYLCVAILVSILSLLLNTFIKLAFSHLSSENVINLALGIFGYIAEALTMFFIYKNRFYNDKTIALSSVAPCFSIPAVIHLALSFLFKFAVFVSGSAVSYTGTLLYGASSEYAGASIGDIPSKFL